MRQVFLNWVFHDKYIIDSEDTKRDFIWLEVTIIKKNNLAVFFKTILIAHKTI